MAVKKSLIWAHLALFTVGLIYGVNYVIAKGLMPQTIGPEAFVLIRVSGALILFWFVRVFVKEKIKKADFIRLFFCGMTGVAINQLFFFKGLSLTSPINSSIIMTINPILVMFIAAMILKNPLTKRKILGIVFGAIGSIALILMSSGDQNTFSSPKGDLFILINAVSYAVYLVIVKPLMSRYKPITVISWVFLFGFIIVLPFGISGALEVQWEALSSWQVFSVIYVVLATTFLAYLLNIYALSIVQPTVSSAYIYLQPIFATLAGLLLANQIGMNYSTDLSIEKFLFAILIFIGVYLVSFGNKPNSLKGKLKS